MAAITRGTISVWIIHGNGRYKNKVAEFPVTAFQGTFTDGFDRNKAIRIPKKVVAVGSRGDYISIQYYDDTEQVDVSGKGDGSIDVEDYTGVPLNTQLGYFGAYSPFPTARPRVGRGDMVGIMHESKRFTFFNELDSRVTSSTTDTTLSQYSEIMRITPNSDGVLLIRAGAIINMDISSFTELA